MAYKISDDCTACGTCIDECPVEAISEGDIYKIDPDACTDCGACADVCPDFRGVSPASKKRQGGLGEEILFPGVSSRH